MLDGSTERRLTLAEVEPSNGLGGRLTDVGHHFRLIVFHAMPEQLALYNGSLPADLLRIQIPDKFHPTGSYNHADKSGQLPKTEPLRLRYSSLQRL